MVRGSTRGGVRGRGRGRGRGFGEERQPSSSLSVVDDEKIVKQQSTENKAKKSRIKPAIVAINYLSNDSKDIRSSEMYTSAAESSIEVEHDNITSVILPSKNQFNNEQLRKRLKKSITKRNPEPAENHLPTTHCRPGSEESTITLSHGNNNNYVSVGTSTETDEFRNSQLRSSSIVGKKLFPVDNGTTQSNILNPQSVMRPSNTPAVLKRTDNNFEGAVNLNQAGTPENINNSNSSITAQQHVVTNSAICSHLCANNSASIPVHTQCNMQQPQNLVNQSINFEPNSNVLNKGGLERKESLPDYRTWLNKLNRIDKQLKKHNKLLRQYQSSRFCPRQYFRPRVNHRAVCRYAVPQEEVTQQQLNNYPSWSTSAAAHNIHHGHAYYAADAERYCNVPTNFNQAESSCLATDPIPGTSSSVQTYTYPGTSSSVSTYSDQRTSPSVPTNLNADSYYYDYYNYSENF